MSGYSRYTPNEGERLSDYQYRVLEEQSNRSRATEEADLKRLRACEARYEDIRHMAASQYFTNERGQTRYHPGPLVDDLFHIALDDDLPNPYQRARTPPRGPPRAHTSSPRGRAPYSSPYVEEDDDLPQDFRRRRSPPPARRRSPSPPPFPRYTGSGSSYYSEGEEFGQGYGPPPRSAYNAPPPRPRSPPRQRARSPPCRPRTPPSSSRSVQDDNPFGVYTYEDEEPEMIPVAPAAWNNHSSSMSRKKLVDFFVSQGFSQSVAESEVGKGFAAHAATHVAGETRPGRTMAEMRNMAERGGRER